MIFDFPGIGRETAKFLAKYGAEVIALSRTKADLDSLSLEVGDIKLINPYTSSLFLGIYDPYPKY